ncbi:MAG: GNAT family N-acetyltransferase [Chloroflexi bacterium]|nr:GNAT family N-acetyltransferase [Chloroflexota bacterium]
MIERIEAPIAATLRNGRVVTIRPLAESDRDELLAFGRSLPNDDWLYLEDDLQNPEIITRLVNAHAAENWRQIVAVTESGEIVGYSAVRRLPGWSSHVGDIQLMVRADYRRCGLGTAMAQAIFEAARDLGVAKVIVEVMQEQTGGIAIFERLGFCVEGTFSDHARDRFGARHHLHILAYHVT